MIIEGVKTKRNKGAIELWFRTRHRDLAAVEGVQCLQPNIIVHFAPVMETDAGSSADSVSTIDLAWDMFMKVLRENYRLMKHTMIDTNLEIKSLAFK